MHKAMADPEKNRLTIILEGLMNADEAKQAADEVSSALGTLKPGMDIINDISKFKPSSEETQAEIVRAQQSAVKAGAKRVIRVIESIIGKSQFKRLQQVAGASYEVFETGTLDEAVSFLDNNP